MRIVLTGTGSPLPDPNRAGPSTLITVSDGEDGQGQTQVLVDAGRGTVMRLAAAGSLPAFLSGVLITHLHSDHVCALNDVITTHWVMTQGHVPLVIHGPPGIDQFVKRQLHALEPDIGYRIAHHDALTVGPQVVVTELDPGDAFTIAGAGGTIEVTTAATEHPPVAPTIGYRLRHGDVSAAIVGDTVPCPGVDELAVGADAYVQTVIRRDLVEVVPNQMFQDIIDYHSSVIDAAKTAARVGAARLILTHLVPAPSPEQYPEWVARAAEHFDGEVIIGDDLTTITL